MIRNRFFSITVLLAAGLLLAVLLLPGGVFAQDGSTDEGSNGQTGAAASGMIIHGGHHAQMHANTGQMGHAMIGTGHIANHANMAGTMTGMHVPMGGSGMGHIAGSVMGHMMDTNAEHQQHIEGTAACPLDAEDMAEHATTCSYQSGTTGE